MGHVCPRALGVQLGIRRRRVYSLPGRDISPDPWGRGSGFSSRCIPRQAGNHTNPKRKRGFQVVSSLGFGLVCDVSSLPRSRAQANGLRSLRTVAGYSAAQTPPCDHELLGLSPDETDVRRIQKGAADRYQRVRRYTLGPQRVHALRILSELADALVRLIGSDWLEEAKGALSAARGIDRRSDFSLRYGLRAARLSSSA